MPNRLARPFAPPWLSPAARGCLASLAVACGLAFAGLGAGTFVAGTYALAHAGRARPSRIVQPPPASPVDLAAARRRWGAIRAGIGARFGWVPA